MRSNYRPIVTLWRQMSSQSNKSNDSKSKGSAPKISKSSPKKTVNETIGASNGSPTATGSGQIDDGIYRSPEYYGHNGMTFYDFMVDMSKQRLKQPSNKS